MNPSAVIIAKSNGFEVFVSAEEISDKSVDVIIPNNALEHTLQPLQELKTLYKKLEADGKIIFIVPCESITCGYKTIDKTRHFYSWSPRSIGNLFMAAGFSVIESKPYIHKWPPKYRIIAKVGGRRLFETACRIYGRIARSWFQVRVIAEKKCA